MDGVDGGISLLFLLAATALPARRDARPVHGLAGLIGLGLALGASRFFALPPSAGAGLLAVWAAAELLLSPPAAMSLLAAGFSAGLAASTYVAAGAIAWLAIPLAGAVPVAALWLNRRGRLGAARLRDEALTAVTWTSILAAALPALVSGWDSAIRLNRSVDGGASAAVPSWVWLFVAVAATIGLVHAWWVRR